MVLVAAAVLQDAVPPSAVSVSVTVTRDDVPVAGLTAADFRVFEDGREQALTSVTSGSLPLSLAIVIDTSDSTAGLRQQLAQEFVKNLVGGLGPEDEVAIVSYDGTINVPVRWTSPKELPVLEWARWKTMPSNEMLQGVYQAFGLMNDAKNQRLAIVAISDAQQIASKHRLADFVKSRRESETAIYGVRTADLLSGTAAIGGPRPTGSGTMQWESRGALISLDDLVRDSGGVVVPARTTTEAAAAADRVLKDLRSQYLLTFTSSKAADKKYRRVKVELRNRSDKLRFRQGYFAG